MFEISRARIRMKAAHAFAVNARTRLNSKFFRHGAFNVARTEAALLRIVRGKLNYVPDDFLPDINGTSWPGLVAQGGSDANANADAKEIVPFCFKAPRESFGHGGEDRRRGWPWQSPRRGPQRAISHAKTDDHTEIKVFTI
jgi:hypothetical protein